MRFQAKRKSSRESHVLARAPDQIRLLLGVVRWQNLFARPTSLCVVKMPDGDSERRGTPAADGRSSARASAGGNKEKQSG